MELFSTMSEQCVTTQKIKLKWERKQRLIYANPSNFKVSECLFFTDRIKQGNQFDVILLYS